MAGLTDEQQRDIWVWAAADHDPNTPKTGRADDRFHFPPMLVALEARLDAKLDALAAKVDALVRPAPATVDTAVLTAAVQSAVNAVKGSITFGA